MSRQEGHSLSFIKQKLNQNNFSFSLRIYKESKGIKDILYFEWNILFFINNFKIIFDKNTGATQLRVSMST